MFWRCFRARDVGRRRATSDDLGERFRIETGAANEHSVDFVFGHEAGDVIRLDAAAIDDAQLPCGISSEAFFGFAADELMRVGSDLRRRSLTGADRPDGFVGEVDAGELFFGEARDAGRELPD